MIAEAQGLMPLQNRNVSWPRVPNKKVPVPVVRATRASGHRTTGVTLPPTSHVRPGMKPSLALSTT